MTDQLLRILFSADTSQATQSVRSLSAELVRQREAQKIAFYEERARSAAARVDIQNLIVEDRRRQNEIKGTTTSIIALAKAEENLRRAQANARNASNYLSLRREEVKQLGVSGLDRVSMNRGLDSVGNLLIGELGSVAPGLTKIGTIARTVFGSTVGGGVVGEALSGATMAAGAATAAIGVGLVGAFGAVAASAGYLAQELQKAQSEEVKATFLAQSIKESFGTDYKKADQIVRDQRERAAILGRDLPVEASAIAQNRATVTDNVALALKEAGLGPEQLNKYLDPIAKITTATMEQGAGSADLLLNKLYAGSSLSELSRIDSVEKNPMLRSALEATFKKYGIKDTGELQGIKRSDFVVDLANTAVSDESLKRLQNTAKAKISAFYDKLFDPIAGLFGVERDLDEKKEGAQTVYSSFSRTMDLVLGENGIFDNLSKILGGSDFDAMKSLQSAIEGMNDFLVELNKTLEMFATAKEFVANIGLKDVKVPWAGDRSLTVGGAVSSGIGAYTDAINPFPEIAQLGQGVGQIFNSIFGLFKPRFAGNLPGEMGGGMGLIDAIATETRNKPAGSDLVIANSGEYIFPTLGDVMSFAGGRAGPSVSIAPGAIVINALPGQNVEAIADAVLDRFNLKLAAEMASYA